MRSGFLKLNLCNRELRSTWTGADSLRKARLAAAGADGEKLHRLMCAIDPKWHDEWFKLLTDDQLMALIGEHEKRYGVSLSQLSDADLKRIIAGHISEDELRRLCTGEE